MKLTSARPSKPRAAGVPAEPQGGKTKKRGRGPLIAVLTVVAVLLAAFVAGTLFVQSQDTIYPKVHVGGVSLGGMTEAEAAQVLRDSGYETGSESVRAIVRLPNGEVIEVTADEAALRPDAELASSQAYEWGRGRNIFINCVSYFKCLLGSDTVLATEDIAEPDEAAIRERVQPFVQALNEELSGGTYTLTDTAIELYKGTGGVLADVDGVCKLVTDSLIVSLNQKSPVSVEYTLPADASDGGVDFKALYGSIHTEPAEAVYDPETQTVTQSKNGVSFDIGIADSLYDSAGVGELVTIPLIITAPEMTTEELEELLFRDILAENTTTIDGSSNRLNNITLAAEAVNGTVLNPGDIFSYNDIVGKRTTEKGYLTAGAYANGRTVQEVGGGICQVSSALYDCTLHADLEVVERRNHQFIVSYLPLGNDATINWGTTDYQFKNDTEYPIRIETSVDGRKLNVKFIGTSTTDETIKIEYTVLGSRDYEVRQVEDETVAPGTTRVDNSGSRGYTVETYKCRYDKDDNLISRDYIARSAYNAQTRIILVPVGTLNPEETPDVSPDASHDPGAETPDVSPTPTPEETSNPYEPPVTEEPAETPAGVVTEEPSPSQDVTTPTPESSPDSTEEPLATPPEDDAE